MTCLYAIFLLALQPASAQYDFSETGRLLDKYQRQLGGNVVTLVWKDGQMIFKKEQGNYSADTQIPIASCSKWLTAALVMTFVDEGKLSLDDSIGKFLPVFTQYGKGGIKLRHCLSHTTGLESGSMNILTLIAEYRKREKMGSLGAEVDDFARNRKLIAAPGSEFRYSSIGLNIAGHILEVISKKSFGQLFQERIARPLGMLHTSFETGKGPVNPSGSAASTANDYMKFMVMILQKGKYGDNRILSEQSVLDMQRPQIDLSMVKSTPRPAEGFTYALGEWVEETSADGSSTVVASPGLFGSWPLVDNCHHYACLFFIRSLLNNQQRDIYMEIKKTMDGQMTSSCHNYFSASFAVFSPLKY